MFSDYSTLTTLALKADGSRHSKNKKQSLKDHFFNCLSATPRFSETFIGIVDDLIYMKYSGLRFFCQL